MFKSSSLFAKIGCIVFALTWLGMVATSLLFFLGVLQAGGGESVTPAAASTSTAATTGGAAARGPMGMPSAMGGPPAGGAVGVQDE